jgi:F0F1-type ATP synthase epsilon subunit
MKKITILAALLTVSFFGYSQEVLVRKVISGDTCVITTKTAVLVDTLSKKQAREELIKVNQDIKNNNESKVLQIDVIQAEYNRLDAIYQSRKIKLKAILAK